MTFATWGVTDAVVRYGRRTALDGVSISVPAGAITAVIGGDGAGKTTLLRLLAGVVRPSSGSLRRPPRHRIGYVAGTAGIWDDLTVSENIAFVGGAYGLRGPALAARAGVLLSRVGLEGTGGRLAGRLSGGMRQKLAFALAMLHEPQLLILDEPTTGVDPVSRADLWRLIAGAAAGGAGVVVSTVYLDEAERASCALLLDGGRTVAAGGPAAVAAALPPQGAGLPGKPDRRWEPAGATSPATLAATYGAARRFGRFTAVAGVDLAVHAGEVVGLLGANGAGKTTLIRMVLGLTRASDGRVELFGRAPSRATRARLGYVPQGLGLWDDLTVAENLAFSARAFGSRVPRLEPDLAEEATTLVRDLPLGLRRRLAFAVALAHEPELLVLDEPTSGVDPRARARLWDTVHHAAAGGTGVLATTHHLDEAGFCDRLVMMAEGRVVAAGPLAAIIGGHTAIEIETEHWEAAFPALEADGLPVALIGRTLRVSGGDVARVQAALDARHVAARLRRVPATLEETFVMLAGAPQRAQQTSSDTAPAPPIERKTP